MSKFVTDQELKDHENRAIPEAHNYDSNLKINGSLFGESLQITIADGTSSDAITFDLSPFLLESELKNVDNQECGIILDKVENVNTDLTEIDKSLNTIKTQLAFLQGTELVSTGIQIVDLVKGLKLELIDALIPEIELSLVDTIEGELSLKLADTIKGELDFSLIDKLKTELSTSLSTDLKFDFDTKIDLAKKEINNEINLVKKDFFVELELAQKNTIDVSISNKTDLSSEITLVKNKVSETEITLSNKIENELDILKVELEAELELCDFDRDFDITGDLELTKTEINNQLQIVKDTLIAEIDQQIEQIQNVLVETNQSVIQTKDIVDITNNLENNLESLIQNNNVTIETNQNVTIENIRNITDKIEGIETECKLTSAKPPVTEIVPVHVGYRVDKSTRGRHLILHFVDFDNYPKRSVNSSYRPIQIPLPIDNTQLNWDRHFKDMIWEQGNLYCELVLKDDNNIEFTPPVSGFFSTIEKAEECFSKILNVTTLNLAAIKHHPSSNPKTRISVKSTRPYRAFVMDVNQDNKTICELKLVPPQSE